MSSMKLATIEQITEFTPINGADRIELATVLGWNIIVKKGQFNLGCLCVYIPIDTTVDPTRPYFDFLKDVKQPEKRVRVNTMKMRGVYSQGLVLPLDILSGLTNETLEIGMDVGELLGIEKYEKDNPFVISKTNNNTKNSTPFPTNIIQKTDEDNLRSKTLLLKEIRDKEVYITLKMDGSSMTIIYIDNKLTVCSRNYVVEEDSVMWKYIDKEKFKDRLDQLGKNIVIQGEFCGPKINKNQLGLDDYQFYVFNVKEIDQNRFLGMNDIIDICDKLQLHMVPILDVVTIDDTWTVGKFQQYANKIVYTLPNKKTVPGEGIVVRPIEPFYSSVIYKCLSFKIINQIYKD